MHLENIFFQTDKSCTLKHDAARNRDQRGSAIIIALLIMILLMGFVALAITRTTNETIAASNDAAETRTFEAAHASLEIMTQNFDKIFDDKLNPEPSDITRIKGQHPTDNQTPSVFSKYSFNQDIQQVKTSEIVTMTGSDYQGLSSIRDEWQIDSAARENSSGVEVALRRRFFNNRIPIFQFGIFYDDDLEFHPGPRFDFGGRVHSNDNLFLSASTGLYFTSKVTSVGEVFTNVTRNGSDAASKGENVFIKNASGNNVQLTRGMGSVLTNPVNGSPVPMSSDQPTVYANAGWGSNQEFFQGNLKTHADQLNLPIRISNRRSGQTVDYIELIRRGRNMGDLYSDETGTIVPVTNATADNNITSNERYYNKAGLRVSLADSKAKLPGCASGTGTNAVTTDCGILLNGHPNGQTVNPGSQPRGYKPRAMRGSPYQATEINGERFLIGSRQMWIKIEMIGKNPATNIFETRDITQDFLSLGVTDPPPLIFGMGNNDTRSVIKLQRFAIKGESMSEISADDARYITSTGTFFSDIYNIVVAQINIPYPVNDVVSSDLPHSRDLGSSAKIAPFPINMFDTREGLYFEGTGTFNPTSSSNYDKKVPWTGVMSMVDIDIANLKRFFDGDFDNQFPTDTPYASELGRSLRASDVPSANGWVFYVSDRRGDYDFDGEYDMEDIYGNNDNTLQPGEDINQNGRMDSDTINEAPQYTGTTSAEVASRAAVFEHKFYRRGVRLINGEQLPGRYDAANASNTKGFTFASENGVYVQGNYNANSITSVGEPTPATDYRPLDTADHIPASIAADAVTILSNNWSDAKSFRYPFTLNSRVAAETYVRFAMLAGDTRSSANGSPNQGGSDPRLSGGVHNFKRFLEKWSSVRLNYAGSLINLFNSHNNNGSFKCCSTVYSPPTRNWVFDTSFLDPNRLPPGTPFFQTIQLTGFERLD